MQISWTTLLKCLIVAHFFTIVGCKQGQSNKPSTRQTRIDNKAKQQSDARAKAQAESSKAPTEQLNSEKTQTSASSDEPLQKNLKGKLEDGSFITKDDGKVDLSGQDCTISTIVTGPRAWLRLKLGADLKNYMEIPVPKDLIVIHLTNFKVPTKSKIDKFTNKAKSQYVLHTISGIKKLEQNTQIDVLKLDRSLINFIDKKPDQLTQKDIDDALERINDTADNTADLLFETDELELVMKSKKYLSFTYNRYTYADTLALPRSFLKSESDELNDITDAERTKVVSLDCRLNK